MHLPGEEDIACTFRFVAGSADLTVLYKDSCRGSVQHQTADLIVAPFDPPVPSFLLYVPDECHASRTRIGPYEPAAGTDNHAEMLSLKVTL